VAIDVGCCDQTIDASFLDHEENEFQAKLRILKISSCARLTVARLSNVVESFKDLRVPWLAVMPIDYKGQLRASWVAIPQLL
jgi:hypothetical protein